MDGSLCPDVSASGGGGLAEEENKVDQGRTPLKRVLAIDTQQVGQNNQRGHTEAEIICHQSHICLPNLCKEPHGDVNLGVPWELEVV